MNTCIAQLPSGRHCNMILSFFAIHHNMCSSVCLWLICIYCWTFNPPQTFDKTNHKQSHWSWTGQYNHNDLSWYKNQAQSPLLIWAQVLTHQGFTNSQFKLPFPDIYSRLFSERLAHLTTNYGAILYIYNFPGCCVSASRSRLFKDTLESSTGTLA